jgi:pyrroloquinoline-quinone synthase
MADGFATLSTAARIDAAIAPHAMLAHPFYQAWSAGKLTKEALAAYAMQYFHHVEAFPQAVSATHANCPDREGRRLLAENLAEEEGVEAGKTDHAGRR